MDKNSQKGLTGMRVVDLSRAFAGPFCTKILADLGAEVIKVEHPDPKKSMAYGTAGPFVGGLHFYSIATDMNKKSITVDYGKEEGRQVIYDLIGMSDVIFDNYRPGVMEALKLDYNSVKNVNPSIISCSLTGFNPEGPFKDRLAFDLIAQAQGGAVSLTGEPGRPPARMGLSMGDMGSGMFAAHGIMAAYVEKLNTGHGQRVSVSMLNCMLSFLCTQAVTYFLTDEVPEPVGSGHPLFAPHGIYKVKDGYIAISAIVGDLLEHFLAAIDKQEFLQDARFNTKEKLVKNAIIFKKLVGKVLETKTLEQWLKIFDGKKFAFAPVNTVDKAVVDPDILFSNMIVEQTIGYDEKAQTVKTVGNPIKFPDKKTEKISPAPLAGSDNEAILSGLLKYSAEKMDALNAQKITSWSPE